MGCGIADVQRHHPRQGKSRAVSEFSGPAGTRASSGTNIFTACAGRSVRILRKTPLPWAGWQIALAFAALLFTFSRRSGPLRMPLQESRLSPLEFVDTLGDLYQSAHAAPGSCGDRVSAAAAVFAAEVGDAREDEAAGVVPSRSRAFRMARGHALQHSVARGARHCATSIWTTVEALALVRELHDYSDRLDTRQKPAQENLAWK